MRINRTTLLLILGSVAIIIVGWVASNATQPQEPPATAIPTNYLPFELVNTSGNIEIRVEDHPEDRVTHLQKENDGWEVVEVSNGTGTVVEDRLVDIWLQRFTGIEVRDPFTNDDLSIFGLDVPNFTMQVTGESEYRLQVGNRNPSNTHYYAIEGSNAQEIFLIDVETVHQLVRLAEIPPIQPPPTLTLEPELRLPGILIPDTAEQDLNTFSIINNNTNQQIDFVRNAEDGDWELATGESLDTSIMQVLATNLAFLRAIDAFTVDNVEPLGLDSPSYTIELQAKQNETVAIYIGDTDPSEQRMYAMVDDIDLVVTLNKTEVDLLLDLLDDPPLN